MGRSVRVKLAVLFGALVVPAVAPGWAARLRPVGHEELLAATRDADPEFVFGVAFDGDVPGERWHAQYVDSRAATWLRTLGMGAGLPRLVAPAHAAHLAPGAERADGYFAVDPELHWPWWWPGGGVLWRVADAP